jgi:SAM-dependent methyltransferase
MDDVTTLTLTGERTLPGIADENYWFRRHEAAYAALAPFTLGARLLEAGCGEGYGADLFAGSASRVVALDYDELTAKHVVTRYPGVDVVRGDLQRLPLADGAVDVVACLQVIEHLWDQPGFVADCARVLRPCGTLLVTTPNRLTFSPGSRADDRPLNPFHTRELAHAELRSLLDPQFVVTRVLGLQHGRRLRRFERRHGSLVSAQISGPPETWPRAVRRVVPTVTAADFTVDTDAPETPIGDALDLLVVARRRTPHD